MIRPPRRSPLFPYTPLSRSRARAVHPELAQDQARLCRVHARAGDVGPGAPRARAPLLDRKSTRLNSSHQIISYAVFCLKKKKERRKTRIIDEDCATTRDRIG